MVGSEKMKSPAAEGTTTGRGSSENANRNGPTNITPAEQNVNPRLPSLVAWKDYAARIEATVNEKNPLRATVGGDESGYRALVAEVMLSQDGKVRAPDGLEPTTDEAAAIAAECKAFPWPRVRALSRLTQIGRFPAPYQHVEEDDPVLFVFRDTEGQIVFAQYRIEIERDGRPDKRYLSFTPFDHGWENREPPGDYLPLFGAEQLASRTRIMIHEGAKAAKRMQAMTPEERSRHPWGQELASFGHLGWIGGAAHPDRTDWSQFRSVKEIVVVTDRDDVGEEAVTAISKGLRNIEAEVLWLKFDDRFPKHFDLGDPMPEALFDERGDAKAYVGPMMWELMSPATWATKLGPQPHDGRRNPTVALRRLFGRQWAIVTADSKSLFVSRNDRRRILSEDSFNTRIRGFSDVKNTAELLKQRNASRADALTYEPGCQLAEIARKGTRAINTWVGPQLPFVSDADYAPRLWEAYLEHLIPGDEDRGLVCRWLATLIARPEIRMKYGILLFSNETGTGKGTLCAALSRVLGTWNVSVPSESDVVDSNYNGWLAHRVLVFVHEIYAGSSWRAYNKLKDRVADEDVTVSEKYLPGYKIEARAHFILCSNSAVGVALEDRDRRFLVPRVAERKRPKSDWRELYLWLNSDGPAQIAEWARRYVEAHGHVRPEDEAPLTERKRQLADDSRSPMHRVITDIAEAAMDLDRRRGETVALIDDEVATYAVGATDAKNPLPLHVVRQILEQAGMFSTTDRRKIDGRRRMCCVTRAVSRDAGATELKQWKVCPHELMSGL